MHVVVVITKVSSHILFCCAAVTFEKCNSKCNDTCSSRQCVSLQDSVKVIHGDWWRYYTTTLLHANLLHLLVCCESPLCERVPDWNYDAVLVATVQPAWHTPTHDVVLSFKLYGPVIRQT